MTESDNRQIGRIATEISHYVREHPDAADSVEGIAEWWLMDGERYTDDVLQRALDHLVSNGVLASTEIGGRVMYAGKKRP